MRGIMSFILALVMVLLTLSETGICGLLLFYGSRDADTFLLESEVNRNKVSPAEKNYCFDLLLRFENILSNRSFEELTEQEKEIVKKFHFAFFQTNICTARIYDDIFDKTSYELDKLPDNKISILLRPWDFEKYGWNGHVKDMLPLVEKYIPECNKNNFGDKIDCFSNSGVYVDYYYAAFDKSAFSYPLGKFVLTMLIKAKNKDRVNVLLFKESLFMTLPKLEKKLKNFEDEAKDKPVCMLTEGKINCPFLHLEKTFYPPNVDLAGNVAGLYVVDVSSLKKRECEDLSCIDLKKLAEDNKSLINLYYMYEKLPGSPEEKIKEIEEHIKNNFKTDLCSIRSKRIKIEKGLLLDRYSYILLDREQKCRNYIDLLIKLDYEHMREIYNWLKKELGTRGYIN